MNPYELEIYQKYVYDYTKNRGLSIERILRDVINTEYPIHFDELCRRVSMYYLSASATKKVKDNVRKALFGLSGDYIFDDNFIMPKNAKNRARGNIVHNDYYMQRAFEIFDMNYADNLTKNIEYMVEKRQIKYIYKKELAGIMKKIREKSINIDKFSLYEETAKLLNVRVANNIEYFMKAYDFIDKV